MTARRSFRRIICLRRLEMESGTTGLLVGGNTWSGVSVPRSLILA